MVADLYSKPITAVAYSDIEAFAASGEPPTEGERLDFKLPLDDRVIETVAAMGNTEGGLILLGVGEIRDRGQGTKRIKWPPEGIDRPSVMDAVASMCHATIRPNYVPQMKLIGIPGTTGKYLLVIRVDTRRCPRPLWHEKKGVLVRVGDQNRPADLETLRTLLTEPVRLSKGESLYHEWRGMMRMAGGDQTCLSAVALYPRDANVFETPQKMTLRSVVAKYFDFEPADAEIVAYHNGVEVTSPPKLRDRRFVARFNALGTADLQLYQGFAQIPWDWVLGETYLMLLTLRDERVATVYPVTEEFAVTLTVSNWPDAGISTETLPGAGVPSGHIRKHPPVQQEFDVLSESNLWEIAKRFVDLILAEAGVLYYEGRLAQLSEGSFMGTYFLPEGPYRRGAWAQGRPLNY
jgi:hypothetical protein